MFDRLIESNTAGAEFKSRRRYFLVSSVAVGALFISAVVFSIYASEIGLGADSYELTALLTPVQPPAEAPEPPQPPQRPRFPVIPLIIPILMGIVMYTFTKSAISVVFLALSPLMIARLVPDSMKKRANLPNHQ